MKANEANFWFTKELDDFVRNHKKSFENKSEEPPKAKIPKLSNREISIGDYQAWIYLMKIVYLLWSSLNYKAPPPKLLDTESLDDLLQNYKLILM